MNGHSLRTAIHGALDKVVRDSPSRCSLAELIRWKPSRSEGRLGAVKTRQIEKPPLANERALQRSMLVEQ